MTRKKVTIYTDGACSGNPGPGGWGAVLLYGERRLEISGYDPETTNNRMEIMAAIQALERLKQPCIVTLYSDSAYLVHAFTLGWIDKWQANHWIKSDKKPAENRDLWERLLAAMEDHEVKWVRVKGHANNKENNRCDELATGAIKAARTAEKERNQL